VADAVGELWDLDGRELFESGCYPGGVGSTTLEESDGAAGYDLREGREMADRWAFQGNERNSPTVRIRVGLSHVFAAFSELLEVPRAFSRKTAP
jgi:hypothetical protein